MILDSFSKNLGLNIGFSKVNTIERIVGRDLRSLRDLWTEFRSVTLTMCGTMGRKDGITARGDAATYYPNNAHKDWCVFTHEYVE